MGPEWVSCVFRRIYVHVFNGITFLSSRAYSLDAKFGETEKTKAQADEGEQDAETRTPSHDFLAALANPALWSSLYHGKSPPFVDTEGFGYEQPPVRRAAWSLLQTLVHQYKGKDGETTCVPC